MYVGIDIGGTKTLVAIFNENGEIQESSKFPTSPHYEDFLLELKKTIAAFGIKDYSAGALGMPVSVFDRERGVGISFGNLPWRNVSIHNDVEAILNCPIFIDNDAKLAALYEASLLKDKYHKVLYVTVSTGIGYAFVNDGTIDENIGDGGGRTMLLEHRGKLRPWETFASGRAIVERYGKRAVDIKDEATWEKIARDLSTGLIELVAITQPEIIVIGGSIGTYFSRYGKFLRAELKKYDLPLVKTPPVIGAEKSEEAVVYGCYQLIRGLLHHG